tara:strand:+ start:9819 stop:10895 length:1077 start_codon:yes stop_codon:yes gene_type:complete
MKNLWLVVLLLLPSLSTHALDLKDFSIYGKVALVTTANFENGSQGLGDNSSRLGVTYERADILEGWKIGLRGEWSISTNRNNSGFGSANFDGKQYDVVSNDGPFGNRLGYLWLRKDNFTIAAGKMWSAFYDVPEFTDLFHTDGARASSVYTRTGETDGTYRASEVVQARYKYEDFHFALQTKLTGKESIEYDFNSDGTADSSLVYKQVQAASIRYITERFTLGVSAINLMFDNNGTNESQLSVAYGFKVNFMDFFFNGVYTRAKDLELNEANNQFVHSDGTEAILGYRLDNETTLMLGYNHQSRSESRFFDLNYYYASISKSIKSLDVAAEYVHGDSTKFSGAEDKEKLLKLAASLNF